MKEVGILLLTFVACATCGTLGYAVGWAEAEQRAKTERPVTPCDFRPSHILIQGGINSLDVPWRDRATLWRESRRDAGVESDDFRDCTTPSGHAVRCDQGLEP